MNQTQKHHSNQHTTLMQWQPRDLNSAIQHPWFASFAMSTPRKRSSAQRTEAFNFQLYNVCSIFFVCSEWEWCVSEEALAASLKGCLAGGSCYSFIAAFLDAEGSNIYFQRESDDLWWNRVDYWIAFDGGPQSPWSSHCNNLCLTLTQSISILHLGIYCFLRHTSAEDIDPWQYLQRKSSCFKSSKEMIWHF